MKDDFLPIPKSLVAKDIAYTPTIGVVIITINCIFLLPNLLMNSLPRLEKYLNIDGNFLSIKSNKVKIKAAGAMLDGKEMMKDRKGSKPITTPTPIAISISPIGEAAVIATIISFSKKSIFTL